MKPSSSISIEPLSARAYVCGSLSCLRFVLFSLFPLYFILFTRSPSLIVGRSLYRKRSFFSTFFSSSSSSESEGKRNKCWKKFLSVGRWRFFSLLSSSSFLFLFFFWIYLFRLSCGGKEKGRFLIIINSKCHNGRLLPFTWIEMIVTFQENESVQVEWFPPYAHFCFFFLSSLLQFLLYYSYGIYCVYSWPSPFIRCHLLLSNDRSAYPSGLIADRFVASSTRNSFPESHRRLFSCVTARQTATRAKLHSTAINLCVVLFPSAAGQ